MRALKWLGYTVAASVVLSVVAGLIAAVAIGGALVCIMALVVCTALAIKGLWESRS